MIEKIHTRRTFLKAAGLGVAAMAIPARADVSDRPNILFCIADDWSWPHASIAGDELFEDLVGSTDQSLLVM